MRSGCAKTRSADLPRRTSTTAVEPFRGFMPSAALAGTITWTVVPAASASRLRWRDPSGADRSSTRCTAIVNLPGSPALRGGCHASTRPRIRDQFSTIGTRSPTAAMRWRATAGAPGAGRPPTSSPASAPGTSSARSAFGKRAQFRRGMFQRATFFSNLTSAPSGPRTGRRAVP
jgi:hypothetical protein